MVRKLAEQSKDKEMRKQNRILLLLERHFGRLLNAELNRYTQVLVSEFSATGSVPAVDDDHMKRIEALYKHMAEAATRAFGNRILDQGKALGYVLEFKDFREFFLEVALGWIADEVVRKRITSVSETTRTLVVNAVKRGQSEGLGVAAIASTINRASKTINRERGKLIARTETHSAANAGAMQAAKRTGLNLEKEWLTRLDGRERDEHRAVDGQTKLMDQPFEVGGELLMQPGDLAGSAKNVINCRCGVAYNVLE